MDIITQHELLASRRRLPKSASVHSGSMAPSDTGGATSPAQNGGVETTPVGGASAADKTAEVLSKDYFNKFDSSLAKIKDNLQKIEKTSV